MGTQLEFYLKEIEKRLRNLHELTAKSLYDAMEAFKELDQGLATKVKELSTEIEEISEKIESSVIETIGRRQPVAVDLRKLSVYLQISHSLFRIGRYSYKIAHITNLCEKLEHFKELESLPYLKDLAIKTLDIAMKGILDHDLSQIDELEKMESDSDRETSEMFEEIADYLRRIGPFQPHRLGEHEMEYTTLPKVLTRCENRFTEEEIVPTGEAKDTSDSAE